jgi:cell division protein FtsI (penicillin-binding protein 3)
VITSQNSLSEIPTEIIVRRQHQFAQRLLVSCILFCLGFAVLGYRAFDLQVQKAYKSRKQIKQQKGTFHVSAKRGTIFDRNMDLLAISVDFDSLAIDPSKLRNKLSIQELEKIFKKLSQILNIPMAQVYSAMERDTHFAWIKRHISKSEMEHVIRELGIKNDALIFEQEPKRLYPINFLAAHIIGYTDIDGNGLAGVERFYNNLLNGQTKALSLPNDAKQHHMPSPKLHSIKDIAGANVVLSIDKTIQSNVQEVLEKTVTKFQAKRGIAIVMDPNNGDVLAMAIHPTFDPNLSHKAVPSLRNNWAVSAPYEPGSTLKVLTLAIARELNLFGPSELFDCEGGRMRIGRYTIRDDHPQRKPLTALEVLQHSSNICTAKIGFRIGKKQLYRYLDLFGLRARTDIGLPKESRAILSPPEKWANISLANIAFGQGVAVTPLQLLTAINAVANGGILYRPRLYLSTTDAQGRILQSFQPKQIRRVISTNTSRDVIRMMEAVVTHGTGKSAQIEGIPVAGKTGTAQKPDPHLRGYGKGRIASFVGFLPANRPRLSILVSIDEPKGSSYGGTVAAPAWREIAISSLQHIEYIPTQKNYSVLEQLAVPIEIVNNLSKSNPTPNNAGNNANMAHSHDAANLPQNSGDTSTNSPNSIAHAGHNSTDTANTPSVITQTTDKENNSPTPTAAGSSSNDIRAKNITTPSQSPVPPSSEQTIKTPQFIDLQWDKAFEVAQRFNIKIHVLGSNGRGRARYQRPAANTPLSVKREVTIIFHPD